MGGTRRPFSWGKIMAMLAQAPEEINLREFQGRMTREASDHFRKGKKAVLLQSPTGSGKTVKACWMIQQALRRAKSCWFICHRVELLGGTSNTFNKYGMDHGYVAAGLPMDTSKQLMVCLIDTLKNRLAVMRAPQLAIFDEAHHCGAEGWAEVLHWLLRMGSYVIGLSATPERLDGVGLDEFFEEMVEGPQPAWLMEHGYLSRYRMFCPESVGEKKLVGDMITQYQKNMPGYKFVGFAKNIASSIDYARKFTAAGIPCAHLDGSTKKEERSKIIRAYADGYLDGIFNVGLFTEGFDLSAVAGTDVTIDGLVDNQLTESYALQKQKWGRILRPRPGKIAVINDHVGNDALHGYPDDEEIWSLHGDLAFKDRKKNASGKPPPVHCGGCFNSLKRPLPVKCPHCEKPVPDGMDNILTHKPGAMVEVSEERKQVNRVNKKQEEMACKTLNELVALAVRRGHKNPQTWASEQWNKRLSRYAMIG